MAVNDFLLGLLTLLIDYVFPLAATTAAILLTCFILKPVFLEIFYFFYSIPFITMPRFLFWFAIAFPTYALLALVNNLGILRWKSIKNRNSLIRPLLLSLSIALIWNANYISHELHTLPLLDATIDILTGIAGGSTLYWIIIKRQTSIKIRRRQEQLIEIHQRPQWYVLDNKQDSLGLFDSIIQTMKRNILREQNIYIIGPYGAGKSTLISVIKQKVSESNPNVIFCTINGWGLTEETIPKYILQQILSTLSAHIDITPILDLPVQYSQILGTMNNSLYGLYSLATTSAHTTAPIEKTLSRLDKLLSTYGLLLVVCIEDLERNTNELTYSSALSCMDRIQTLNNVSLILAINEDNEATCKEKLIRIFDDREYMPLLKPQMIRAKLQQILEYFQYTMRDKGTNRLLNTVGYLPEDFDSIDEMSKLIASPRILKKILKRVHFLWIHKYKDEVDLLDILISITLKFTYPHAFRFMAEHYDELTRVNERHNLKEIWETNYANSQKEKQIAENLMQAIGLSYTDTMKIRTLVEETQKKTISMLQGQFLRFPRYGRYFFKEEESNITDKEVQYDVSNWDIEAMTHKICNSYGYADVWFNTVSDKNTSDTKKLIQHFFSAMPKYINEQTHISRTGINLFRVYCQDFLRHNPHQRKWIKKEYSKAISNCLPLAIWIFNNFSGPLIGIGPSDQLDYTEIRCFPTIEARQQFLYEFINLPLPQIKEILDKAHTAIRNFAECVFWGEDITENDDDPIQMLNTADRKEIHFIADNQDVVKFIKILSTLGNTHPATREFKKYITDLSLTRSEDPRFISIYQHIKDSLF